MKIEGALLLRFARYADQIGHDVFVTTKLAITWAKLPKNVSPSYWARRLDIVRRFANHCFLFDRRNQIPPKQILGASYSRRPTPHIYSDDELTSLLDLASRLGPRGGLRPHTYVTILGLLACTGMRISEVLNLTVTDVDLCAGVLTVQETKFKKSRLLPLHSSTVRALRIYAKHRDRYHPRPLSSAFFLTERGTSQKYWRTLMAFSRLRDCLGWPRGKGRPRLHDLRHTFAVKRLLLWYADGADVGQMLPGLSTYLGHEKVTDTYWYFTAVPDLLLAAAKRHERHFRLHRGGRS